MRSDESWPDITRARSFEDFENIWHSRLFNFALKLVRREGGSREDAEDVYANSRYRAFKAFAQMCDPEHGFWVWRQRIITNVWRDEKRRRSSHPTRSLEAYWAQDHNGDEDEQFDPPDNEVDVEDQVINSVERLYQLRLIRRALGDVAEEGRRCVELRYFGDQSYREIAEILQCPLGTVQSRLNRAHIALHRTIENLPNGSF